MREYLALLPGPARYAGIESGAVHKSGAALRVALAFPDTYEVGMSYLGHKILYSIVNAHEGWQAERAVAPEKEAAELLRRLGAPLCSLESDSPLTSMDCVAFAITHELSYVNVLYMLDLAGIELRHERRSQDLSACPLIIAGGGALLSAEPLAPFIDLMLLGDGEESLPEALELLERAKKSGWSRGRYLEEARHIPGAYVPSFFTPDAMGRLVPRFADHARPARRIVADLNAAPYPVRQIVPIGAVHNRISLEIARGCTRGCRFCHAGMVYRPARERDMAAIAPLLRDCLASTGFDEISLLSLSTGDFSGLKQLCGMVMDECEAAQATLCLPSQRVGSIDEDIISRMGSARRTGMTLAPEAGSQRLRDVINKGIGEDDLLRHARALLRHGWRQIKLYFMLGLPTETDADLLAIADLCQKVRDAAGPGQPRLQVTASLSPFVPKPFTPFQWAAQIDSQETERRVGLVRQACKGRKFIKVRWHEPGMSFLEGVFSRGGRELAEALERALRKGAIFPSWMEHFRLEPWLEALAESGLNPHAYLLARDPDAPLPWDHLEAGISREFLLRELQKSGAAATTPDCRYSACQNCGACDRPGQVSRLPHASPSPDGGRLKHCNRLNFSKRDQAPIHEANNDAPVALRPASPVQPADLGIQAVQYRIWHEKTGACAWLSQLELQAMLDRALRRAGIPLAYSRGFHPLPLLSFGRALPVGVESQAEWFALSLRKVLTDKELLGRLKPLLPSGLLPLGAQPVDKGSRTRLSIAEKFELEGRDEEARKAIREAFARFFSAESHLLLLEGKKGIREVDLRPLVCPAQANEGSGVTFIADWSRQYLSPLRLALGIVQLAGLGPADLPRLRLVKKEQIFV